MMLINQSGELERLLDAELRRDHSVGSQEAPGGQLSRRMRHKEMLGQSSLDKDSSLLQLADLHGPKSVRSQSRQ